MGAVGGGIVTFDVVKDQAKGSMCMNYSNSNGKKYRGLSQNIKKLRVLALLFKQLNSLLK